MRGVFCQSVDSLSGLSVQQLPDPIAGPGQVVVTVAAASVDYVDTLIATGCYQIKVSPPFVVRPPWSGLSKAWHPERGAGPICPTPA